MQSMQIMQRNNDRTMKKPFMATETTSRKVRFEPTRPIYTIDEVDESKAFGGTIEELNGISYPHPDSELIAKFLVQQDSRLREFAVIHLNKAIAVNYNFTFKSRAAFNVARANAHDQYLSTVEDLDTVNKAIAKYCQYQRQMQLTKQYLLSEPPKANTQYKLKSALVSRSEFAPRRGKMSVQNFI
jgi:hypothetical protein